MGLLNSRIMIHNSEDLFNDIDWQGKVFTGNWSPGLGGQHQAREPATGETLAAVDVATAVNSTELMPSFRIR